MEKATEINMEMKKIQELISANTDQDISQVLYKHKCFDLILKMPESQCFENTCITYLRNKIYVIDLYNSILPIFASVDFPYAMIKGAVLSNTAYGNPFIRKSGDIDIIVSSQNITTISELMKDNGFIQGNIVNGNIIPATREQKVFQRAFSHQIIPFVKKANSLICPYICVDINTNIIWGEGEKIDMNDVLRHREAEYVNNIKLYKLELEADFIAVCLHHYKELNSIYMISIGSIKLSLFLDIYRYVERNFNDIVAMKIVNLAKHWNVLPYIYYCLKMTNELFPSDIILRYLKFFETKQGEFLVNKFGLSKNEWKDWKFDLGQRLFDSQFVKKYLNALSEEEKKKIEINKRMMGIGGLYESRKD